MMDTNMEITARTSSAWINAPADHKKNPKSHPMTRMMAIRYRNPLIL
jgi:hypothetical protein